MEISIHAVLVLVLLTAHAPSCCQGWSLPQLWPTRPSSDCFCAVIPFPDTHSAATEHRTHIGRVVFQSASCSVVEASIFAEPVDDTEGHMNSCLETSLHQQESQPSHSSVNRDDLSLDLYYSSTQETLERQSEVSGLTIAYAKLEQHPPRFSDDEADASPFTETRHASQMHEESRSASRPKQCSAKKTLIATVSCGRHLQPMRLSLQPCSCVDTILQLDNVFRAADLMSAMANKVLGPPPREAELPKPDTNAPLSRHKTTIAPAAAAAEQTLQLHRRDATSTTAQSSTTTARSGAHSRSKIEPGLAVGIGAIVGLVVCCIAYFVYSHCCCCCGRQKHGHRTLQQATKLTERELQLLHMAGVRHRGPPSDTAGSSSDEAFSVASMIHSASEDVREGNRPALAVNERFVPSQQLPPLPVNGTGDLKSILVQDTRDSASALRRHQALAYYHEYQQLKSDAAAEYVSMNACYIPSNIRRAVDKSVSGQPPSVRDTHLRFYPATTLNGLTLHEYWEIQDRSLTHRDSSASALSSLTCAQDPLGTGGSMPDRRLTADIDALSLTLQILNGLKTPQPPSSQGGFDADFGYICDHNVPTTRRGLLTPVLATDNGDISMMHTTQRHSVSDVASQRLSYRRDSGSICSYSGGGEDVESDNHQRVSPVTSFASLSEVASVCCDQVIADST